MSGNLTAYQPYMMTDLCKEGLPGEPEWICSLKKSHKGQHAAYYNHSTAYRSALHKRWPNERFSPSEDDVAAAIASITGTLQQRQLPVQMPVPIQGDIHTVCDNHYNGIIADKDALIEHLEKERDDLRLELVRVQVMLSKVRTRVAHVVDAIKDP